MTEALTRAKPRIEDPEELDPVVRRLVESFDPVAVYLFGSRARKARAWVAEVEALKPDFERWLAQREPQP